MGRPAPSAEELAQQALANGFRAGVHKVADKARDQGKHVTKTIKDQDGTLRRYVAFCVLVMKQAQADRPDLPPPTEAMARAQYLCPGAAAPDLATTKDFVRFFISLMKPKLDKEKLRPTVDSVNTTAEWFFAGFTRVTGTMTDAEDRSEVFSWVRNVLTKEGIVVIKHSDKHNLQCVDATRLLKVLWTKDDLIYIPERYRIQATWVFDLYCWTGARLSAFFTGGLHYKDVDLVLMRHEKNGKNWKLAYKLNQRWIKNNRDPENIVCGAVTNEHNKFIYNGAGFFLTMAIADKAIWGFESLRELQEQKIPPGQNELKLRYRESAADRPIIRKCTKANGVTEEPMPKSAFTAIFNKTLQNAGYLCSTSVHAIRREIGKKVDESYTPVQRSQHLTQADTRVFGQSYVANCSSVDGGAAWRGEQLDHSAIDYFQGYGQFRQEGLPCSLPAFIEEEMENDPMIQRLAKEVQTAVTADTLAEAKRCLFNARRRWKRDRLPRYQKEWIQERRDWQVVTRGEKTPDDPSKEDFFRDMCFWRPERGRLAKIMASDEELTSDEMWLAIVDLYALCTQDYTVLYLPRVVPIGGRCPVESCSALLNSIPSQQHHKHMFACIRKEIAIRSAHPPSEIHYCYHCFEWVVGNDWGAHCSLHLPELSSKRCGAVLYCHTLARPAYCPFCLGNQQLVSSKRMQSWARDHQAVTHVALHMRDCHYPMACPHPLCETSLLDRTSLRFHFIDDHGMSAKLPKDVVPKNQSTILEDSFVVVDSPATLKRRLLDRSQPETPSKRMRGTAAAKLPLCTTTTEAEHPCSAFSSKDEVVATEDIERQDAFSNDYDDLFAEFIRTPPFSDSGEETAVEQDLFAERIHTPPFKESDNEVAVEPDLLAQCRDNGHTEPQEIRRTIRIRLRVQPPKPVVTLRLTNPKAKKGRKPTSKNQWKKRR